MAYIARVSPRLSSVMRLAIDQTYFWIDKESPEFEVQFYTLVFILRRKPSSSLPRT
jgi:hypothetical protein